MAAVGTIQLQAAISGAASGARTFNASVPLAAAATETVTVALSAGSNTISVPTGASLVIISTPNMASPTPNPSYGGTLTVNTSVIANDKPHFWAFPNTVSSFTITATSSCTVDCFFA